MILLPADLEYSGNVEYESEILAGWYAIYWITFLSTWIVLPVVQEFVYAGDFTFWAKLKYAIRENLRLYLYAAILILLFVIYVSGCMPLQRMLIACAVRLFSVRRSTKLLRNCTI